MKENIYTTYAQDTDITFILKDTYSSVGVLLTTTVVGFYYGEPNEKNTLIYQHECLKAEFKTNNNCLHE